MFFELSRLLFLHFDAAAFLPTQVSLYYYLILYINKEQCYNCVWSGYISAVIELQLQQHEFTCPMAHENNNNYIIVGIFVETCFFQCDHVLEKILRTVTALLLVIR